MKKITITLLSLLALSACSTTKKATMSATAESSLEADFEKNAGDRVYFAYDSSALSKESKEQLHKQISWLQSHPNVRATIEGHCDERGTVEYNLALGERRAEAVRKYYVNNGIDASRIDALSYGKERPAVVGHDESSWKFNRRSVTVVK